MGYFIKIYPRETPPTLLIDGTKTFNEHVSRSFLIKVGFVTLMDKDNNIRISVKSSVTATNKNYILPRSFNCISRNTEYKIITQSELENLIENLPITKTILKIITKTERVIARICLK